MTKETKNQRQIWDRNDIWLTKLKIFTMVIFRKKRLPIPVLYGICFPPEVINAFA